MSRQQATHLKILAHPEPSKLALAAQSFLLSREAMACTPAPLIWYRKYVKLLVDYLESAGIDNLEDITPDVLRRYILSLQARRLSPITVHHCASAARTFLNFLVEEELLRTNPMNRVAMPRLPKEIKPAFAPEDVRRLLDACETRRDTAIVLCLLDSGARAAEFCALTYGSINLTTGAVIIRQGKGRKDRVAFLGSKAGKALTRYLMERKGLIPNSPLWLSERGGSLTTWGLSQLLQRLGKKAGVEHCSAHTFRRTCALWSLRAGMSIYHLQSMLGHSDLSVLRRYLALVEGDLEEAHKKHGAVDNLL